MNLLLISEIREGLTPPGFGGEFAAHIERKTHPAVRAASLTAWNLLVEGLGRMGYAGAELDDARMRDAAPEVASANGKITPSQEITRGEKASPLSESAVGRGKMPLMPGVILNERDLPAVHFGERGKPEFIDYPLHFSLAHSGKFAVALLSPSPCGVDVERVRPGVDERLRARCLSEEEQRRGMDFFECWVKKECVGKLNGHGIDAHPGKINTLDARWAGRFFFEMLVDSAGQSYALAALCEDAKKIARSVVRI